ncbi:helix-turn-helix domain-containing protein [Enterococcus sp. LJL99]
MATLGVLCNNEEFLQILENNFQSDKYRIISVVEKNQFKLLDGLIIHIDGVDWLSETVDWLLYSKSNPGTFIWIVSPENRLKEQSIFLELGASEVFFSSENLVKISYIVKNTFTCMENRLNQSNLRLAQDTKKILNDTNQTILVNGKEQVLTRTEYRILLILVGNANKTVSYQELSECLWENENKSDYVCRVANIICHLRTKLKSSQDFEIVTTRSIGYVFKWKREV